jgi:tRNA nucleotidyltransferase (CCA-adding enzyme)
MSEMDRRALIAENLRKLESGESLQPYEKLLFDWLAGAGSSVAPPIVPRVAGGWVRDALLGLRSNDVDIAVDICTGLEFADTLRRYLETSDPSVTVKVRGNREQSQHLASARIEITGMSPIDVCQLRSDEYTPASRIPTIRVGTPEEDAHRRDCTINALFFNVQTRKVEDFHTGLEDLGVGIIRTLTPPLDSFAEDPLRILRAFRFGARFGLAIDPAIFDAARQEVPLFLGKVTRPMMEKEVRKTFKTGDPLSAVDSYIQCGLFAPIFDHTGSWHLDADVVRSRVAIASRDLPKVPTRYSIVLVAIYKDLFTAGMVIDPVNGRKKVQAAECAIVRCFSAAASVFQLSLKLFTAAKAVPELRADVSRVSVGKWLRGIGELWTLTKYLLFSEDDQVFFTDRLVPFVEAEGLVGVWTMKPILNGAEIGNLHNVKGKGIVALLDRLIEWQLSNPGGSADDYRRTVASMPSSQPES